MSDEEQKPEGEGKPKFGRRPRHDNGQGTGGASDSGNQPKKPKVRIGPKNRRSEAASEPAAPPEPAKREPQPQQQRSRGPHPGKPKPRQDRPRGQNPQNVQSQSPTDQGGIRRKRRRRKGHRQDDGPMRQGGAEESNAPFRSDSQFPSPPVGRQVLPPVQDDLDEVPSGIFLTSDLSGGDSSVGPDSDSDADSDSDFDDPSDLPSGSEADDSQSSTLDASNAGSRQGPPTNSGNSNHPESRSARDRKRRKKNRRDRHELPPVDRNMGYWWAEQWVRSFEMLFPSNASRSRMAKGRTYARRGQVLELEVGPNGVLARVQGSRPRPYQVRLELNRLRRETWGRILHQLVGKATFLAQLLEGHLPPEIEEVFFSAGARLFPHGDVDIRARCNCPDPVVPCKHVSALNYALADALQRDPFLLFAMRGKGRDQFLQDLREMRGRDRANAPPPPSEEDLSQFWRMGRLAESVLRPTGWSMGNDPARLLQSLGEPQLEGIREGLFLPMLEATYRQVAESMRRLPKDA